METEDIPNATLVEINLDESLIIIEPEAICRRCGKPFQRLSTANPTCSNYYRCKDCIGFLAMIEDSCNIS